MRAKSLILIAIALTCGLIASVGISQVLNREPVTEVVAEEMVNIFVSTRDIDINETVTAENVRLEPWPKGRVPEGAILDIKDLEGRYARTRLYNGEVILAHKLMDEAGGLADTIPPGYRVASVRVTMETAVSNLLKPGDRVDILAILRAGGDIPATMTKRILNAVRIFAVNAETERRVDQNGSPIDAKTISLLVTNEQIPRLLMAHSLGELRLTLRGPDITVKEEDVDDDYNVRQMFEDESTNADDKEKFEGSGTNDGNMSMADFFGGNQPKPTTTPTRPIVDNRFKMTIMTPDGQETLVWNEATGEFTSDAPVGLPGFKAKSSSSEPSREDVETVSKDDDVSEKRESNQEREPSTGAKLPNKDS